MSSCIVRELIQTNLSGMNVQDARAGAGPHYRRDGGI